MEACYTPDVSFSDPVFTDLHGAEAGAMWRMLTGRAKDLEVELLEREADDERGSARWRATYTYSQTGRPVVNDVRGTFRFADGQIAEHEDSFGFHRWARQALGATGPPAGLDADAALHRPPPRAGGARRVHGGGRQRAPPLRPRLTRATVRSSHGAQSCAQELV